MFKSIIDIVIPRCCNACHGHLTFGEKVLCTSCRHQLSVTQFNYCIENECDRSFYGKTSFVKASALFYFDQAGILKALLHQLKYRDQQQLGVFFANWTAAILKQDSCLTAVDYLVPVPLHWRKKHQRGYNQLHLFCKRLSKLMNWNYAPQLLKRVNYRDSQTHKSRVNRSFENNPFELKTTVDLSDQTILIVDDLITTGSTMTHCSNAILNRYPSKIYLLSIGYRSRFV